MTEQLINTAFATSNGSNNPDDWDVVEANSNQIVSDAGYLAITSQTDGIGYIQQTVNNVDMSANASLSFSYFDTSIQVNNPSILKISILDDQGNVAYSWEYNSSTADTITFTPPSESFTVRLENSTLNDIYGMPVYVESISLDATNLPDPIVPCFGKGTLIETENGPRKIEDLEIGDLVVTVDNGLQPIRWIGCSELTATTLSAHPNLAPIHIPANSLGNGTPTVDLVVSPQHRILVKSKIAQRMFDTAEVLIPAIKLVGIAGIRQNFTPKPVSYYHMLFDQHEVVISNGAETESLYTGQQALKAVGQDAYREITSLFPHIMDPAYVPPQARLIPKGKLMKQLAERHAKNNKPLVLS